MEYQEVYVDEPTDIKRLKGDISAMNSRDSFNADFLVITNATILTMQTGSISSDLMTNAILVTRDGVIESVSDGQNAIVPVGATVIDAQGGMSMDWGCGIIINALFLLIPGFITPGFIDVHAHWGGFDTPYPAKSWELETFLAYGVTTLHKYAICRDYGYTDWYA